MYNSNKSARGDRAGAGRPRGRRNDARSFDSERFQEKKHPFVSDHWEDNDSEEERSPRRFGNDRRFGSEDRRGSFNREDRGDRRFGSDRRSSFSREDRG
ncbi:MAG: hypothetical protein K2I87_03975, partial [Bacteroidales bacterium]|nr:hypothetical protein [Bacteroidales bacterium]